MTIDFLLKWSFSYKSGFMNNNSIAFSTVMNSLASLLTFIYIVEPFYAFVIIYACSYWWRNKHFQGAKNSILISVKCKIVEDDKWDLWRPSKLYELYICKHIKSWIKRRGVLPRLVTFLQPNYWSGLQEWVQPQLMLGMLVKMVIKIRTVLKRPTPYC